MRKLPLLFLAVALLTTVEPITAVEPLPANAKVYVNNMGGFGSYLAAAFGVKRVPVVIVTDRRQADFEVVGTSESKNPNWAEVIFLKRGRSNETATISVVNLRTSEVIFAYAYNMGQAYNGKQSAAESCAKHLGKAIASGVVDLGHTGAAVGRGDDDRPAGETTAVPPSEPDAAPAIPPDQLLMSVSVDSQPTDARVEVDGYLAGKTPVKVKLKAGVYGFRVVKPGFQPRSQQVIVEVGRIQSLDVTLTEMTK